MLGRISSFNPSSVQPRAAQLPSENGIVRAMRDNQRIGMERDRLAQQQRQQDQLRKDRAFEQMAQNPRQAGVIAQQYGIAITPEMEQLFKDEGKTKLVLEGTQLAKNLGIERYEAAKVFLENYVSSGGDILAAQQSVGGMDVRNPRQGSSFGHQIKLGNNVYDRRTGDLIIKGPDEGGNDKFFDDPRVPPNLRMEGDILMKGNTLDPSGDVAAYYDKVKPYLEQPMAQQQNQQPMPSTQGNQMSGAMISPIQPPSDEPGSKFMGFDIVNGVAKFQRPDGSSFGLRNYGQ